MLFMMTTTATYSTVAYADLTNFGIGKGLGYQQTSNSQPSTVTSALGAVAISEDDGSAFATAHVTASSPLSPITLGVVQSGDAFNLSSIGQYDFRQAEATQAALDTDFPQGAVYQYTVSGGTLGTQTASLTSPTSNQFPPVPFFSGTTFSQLQGMNSAASIQFTWSGFTPAPGFSSPSILLDMHRVSDGQEVPALGLRGGDNTFTSFLLHANALQPATTYDLSLIYFNESLTSNAGFNGASSEFLFGTRTDLVFTTAAVPEPSSVLLLGVGGLGLIAYRHRRRCTLRNRIQNA
jgi:hypothetical protein